MSTRFADLTLTQVRARLLRYRPLVVTVAVTLALLRILPGGEGGGAATAVAAATTPTTVRASVPAVPPSITTALPPTITPPLSVTLRPFVPPAGGTLSHSPSPSPTTTVAPPLRTTATTVPAAPPIVRYTGWASRGSGTPVGAVGVPDGALPVGASVSQVDKVTFLKLEGNWSTLFVVTDPDGDGGLGAPAVLACPIDGAWDPGADQTFEEAPTWGDACTAGREVDGGWQFDVGDLDRTHGVALVPDIESSPDFQIALRHPQPA